MTTFLWTMLALLVVEGIGRIIWLCGEPPRRTRAGVAIDLAAGVSLLVWVVILLERA